MLIALPHAHASATSPEDARNLIIEKSGFLVTRLKQQHLDIKQKPEVAFDIAEDTVLPYIDFAKASQSVLGKHWRRATDEQKTRFIKAFREYLVGTYVRTMVTYVDEIISHADNVTYLPLRQQNISSTRVTVQSLIALANGNSVAVDYRLYLDKGKWKIYDVVIENVSLAITHRSTFYSHIASNGLNGLIEQLEQRNKKNGLEN
jgi:phospholipid transport system substrate-binding protein